MIRAKWKMMSRLTTKYLYIMYTHAEKVRERKRKWLVWPFINDALKNVWRKSCVILFYFPSYHIKCDTLRIIALITWAFCRVVSFFFDEQKPVIMLVTKLIASHANLPPIWNEHDDDNDEKTRISNISVYIWKIAIDEDLKWLNNVHV